MEGDLHSFLKESLAIEGIHREPNEQETEMSEWLLSLPRLDLDAVLGVQAIYAPHKPLRTSTGMDVWVGSHRPPRGGPMIEEALAEILRRINVRRYTPYLGHVAFETLHPFMDGNGRTGRIIWAWHMRHVGGDPFALPFLHCWYYQSLENADGR